MKKLFLILLIFANLLLAITSDKDTTKIHKVIIPSDWPPYYKVDKKGTPTGFAIEIFEEVAKHANIKYQYIIVPSWKEVWETLEKSDVHIIPDVGHSKEREKLAFISEFTNTLELTLFRRVKSSENFKTMDDLKSKKVAVVHSNVCISIMSEYKEVENVVFLTHFDAIRALLSGEVDALCYPKTLMNYTLYEMNINDKIESFYKSLGEVKRGIGISKKHTELIDPINSAISEMKKDGTYDKIYKKWFEKDKLIEFTKKELFFLLFTIVVFFTAIILISYFITTKNKWLITKKDLEKEIINKTKNLQERDKFLDAIYNSIPSIIFTRNEKGIVNANNLFFDIVGFKDVKEILDKKFCIADLFEAREGFLTKITKDKFWIDFVYENKSNIHRAVIVKNDKEHIYQVRVVDLITEDNFKLILLSDITDLEEIKDELERSNEDLQQFAYIASHDLQEPLRMVSSYLQLIERRYREKLDSDGIEFIDYAVDGAKRMQDLINGLLQFSRVKTQGEELVTISMKDVFTETLYNLSILITEKDATINIPKDLPDLRADKRQMIQLMQNLISNAIKYSDIKPVIDISFEETSENILFKIKDNGIGIDEQYFEKIFLIFQRLHQKGDKYGGTGIGLAVCKRIIQRHHGRIWLESKKTEGTTFFISFPKKGVLHV
jgi:signal transduction histidine kinase/ABC-type amino acid transport substrate-binding protein